MKDLRMPNLDKVEKSEQECVILVHKLLSDGAKVTESSDKNALNVVIEGKFKVEISKLIYSKPIDNMYFANNLCWSFLIDNTGFYYSSIRIETAHAISKMLREVKACKLQESKSKLHAEYEKYLNS